MRTYFTGIFCLIAIFVSALMNRHCYIWLVGVGLILLTLVIRSCEVEIEKKNEKKFHLIIVAVTIMTLIFMLF